MTAKRFTVDDGLEDVLCWEINDKENEDMTCGECAKLLNALHEENEQLKRNQSWLKTASHLDTIAHKDRDYAKKMHKENEQLKQAYAQLKHRHSLLHDECIDAECDRDSYRKDIASLEKENEQLKHSIKCLEADKMELQQYIKRMQGDVE